VGTGISENRENLGCKAGSKSPARQLAGWAGALAEGFSKRKKTGQEGKSYSNSQGPRKQGERPDGWVQPGDKKKKNAPAKVS